MFDLTIQGHPYDLPKGFDEGVARSQIVESHSYFEELENAWDALTVDHEGQWVAAYKGQFVFGATIQDVLAAAKQKKWPLDVIAIDRLTKERATVLL